DAGVEVRRVGIARLREDRPLDREAGRPERVGDDVEGAPILRRHGPAPDQVLREAQGRVGGVMICRHEPVLGGATCRAARLTRSGPPRNSRPGPYLVTTTCTSPWRRCTDTVTSSS